MKYNMDICEKIIEENIAIIEHENNENLLLSIFVEKVNDYYQKNQIN